MSLSEEANHILLNLVCAHRQKLSSEDGQRKIMMVRDVLPVFSDNLKYSPSYAIAFDGRFDYFFANHDRHTAINSVLVLTVFEQEVTVTDGLAVAV